MFGVPFVLLIVGASFAMTTFTQTKYDLQASRQATVSYFQLSFSAAGLTIAPDVSRG